MANRYCIACGEPVDSAYCSHCGLRQPAADSPTEHTLPAGTTPPFETTPPPAPVPPASSPPVWYVPPAAAPAVPLDATRQLPITGPVPPGAGPPMASPSEQPWHPFERPPWETPTPVPADQPPAFVEWQSEPPPPATTKRRTALLGGLAAAVVVALLVVVGILIVRSNRAATPDDGSAGGGASTNNAPATRSAASTEAAPPVTVTETAVSTVSTASPTSSTEVTTSAGADPMGGPVQDIACAPGYIVQIASGLDEASYVNRVAALRASGQLPANVFVAHTASSCAIFSSQTNTIVLYAGPFNGPYDGCDARLKSAPDSFIKGTTPETAHVFISCLCPTTVTTLPAITAINQTGVWIGELQRVLGNKLNYDIPDLGDQTWGVFTQSTSAAVSQFQTDNALPVTGTVDAATWQAIQGKACV